MNAYTTEEFFASAELSASGTYDSMLCAHVIEHLTHDEAREVIGSYLPTIKPGGTIVWLTPQERGFYTGETHITFVDFAELRSLADDLGLEFVKQYSFPFPRFAGRFFTYNEFVAILRRPAS
jgi:2-polyprenyl-3-methyl-5-hydroxy-6-metoxy-1,4-benzoquinol methylase